MSRPPTVNQLRNLADRADRGPLQPAEVARLREGIDHLATEKTVRQPSRPAANRLRRLRQRLRYLHAPLERGGIEICGHCSGWNGTRCLGLVTPYPCPTIDHVDGILPGKEAA